MSLRTYSHLYSKGAPGSGIPAAMIFKVDVVHPDPNDGRRVTKEALIDTGADACVIPRTIRNDWNLTKADDATFLDWLNRPTTEPTYNVRIEIPGLFSDILEVTVVDGDEILLGRDALNEIRLVADGKGQWFALQHI
jgi:predicted aspartyl protease